jgi:DNA-3-methyladenine glycosylase II
MNDEAIHYLRSVDPVLERLIASFGHLRIEPRRLPPFQSLIHAIAHQQLTGKVASTILKRFQALFGNGSFPDPGDILQLDAARICSAGFSKAKASFILAVAEKAATGLLPELSACGKMTDAQILERLMEIKGVGRWTAEMFLIFNLGRPDVLPVHDLGVRRGFQIAYRKRKLPEPRHLEKVGRQWHPYRTTAALYLYRAADQLKEGEW